MIKKTYHISGFDCPNCAAKTEIFLVKQEGIEYCHIDFSTNKLFMTFKDKELSKEEILALIAKVESDPIELSDLSITKKTYHISGFDCPNCAAKTEIFLNKQDAIEYCHIDFSTNKMYVTFKGQALTDKEILSLIAKVESDPIELHEVSEKKKDKIKIFTNDMWYTIGRIIFGVIVILFNMLLIHHYDETGWMQFAIYEFAALILSYDIAWRVLVHIKNRQNIIDHNLLMTIAVIGATTLSVIYLVEGNAEHGAHLAMEGMMVVGLFQIGNIVEKIGTNRSKAAVASAVQLRVEYANLVKDNEIVRVEPEELKIGDVVAIGAGEMIPVDGEIIDGSAYVDKSSLTGEFVPVLADVKNSKVLAGFLVKSGFIKVKVAKKYEDSSVAKIIELISNSGEKKSKADDFINKFARFYTPVIVLISIIAFLIGGLITRDWREWVIRGLEILVTGCPCAIVISVPLAYFAGLGLASKKGIVIKGTNYLDEINDLKTVVTDKTGTLTRGVFTIQHVKTSEGVEEQELLNALYAAECLSTHPIAKAICHEVDTKALAAKQKDFREIAGFGVQTVNGKEKIFAGNLAFMKENGLDIAAATEMGTAVYCQKDGKYLGYVVLNDEVKKEAYDMVKLLHKEKMSVVLLTGDKKANADALQKELNLDEVYSELTPDQKTVILEQQMEKNHGNVAFLGDGINDAPSIMRSDVGFAMGAIGSDIAVENANVVIINDNPAKVYEAVKIARIARHTAIFNVLFALFVKFTVAVLVVIPTLSIPMTVPVIADTGLTVALIINSLLILYRKVRKK